MKLKKMLPCLLACALLAVFLSGCSVPAESSPQPAPSAVTDQNGVTTLTNVVVMDVRGTTLELMEQSDDPNNLYRYELVVPNTDSSFWQDAQGNPVSVEQFTYCTPVTVELNKELGQPALEPAEQEWDRNVFTYRVTCLGENDVSVRLTGEPRPEAAPFETLTRAQVASGELFQGNSQSLGEQDLDEVVGCLPRHPSHRSDPAGRGTHHRRLWLDPDPHRRQHPHPCVRRRRLQSIGGIGAGNQLLLHPLGLSG